MALILSGLREAHIILALTIKKARGTATAVYRDALKIRQAVFVVEQQVPLSLEIDEFESVAINYVGYLAGQAVVTCRILLEPDQGWHVQRVATVKAARHNGYGRALLQAVIAAAREQGVPYLILGAQLTAVPFYEKLGFTATARPVFLDANIRHREMRYNLTA